MKWLSALIRGGFPSFSELAPRPPLPKSNSSLARRLSFRLTPSLLVFCRSLPHKNGDPKKKPAAKAAGFVLFSLCSYAPIVQWIEQLTPNEQIHVRLMVGAQKTTWYNSTHG